MIRAKGLERCKQQLEIPMPLADQIKPVSENLLGTLDSLLAKAEANGGDTLLSAKLAPDMFPLATQVRIACDQVSSALKRLTDSTFVLPDEDDATIPAARERIAATRAAIAAQADASFAAPDAPIAFDLPNGMAFGMTAGEYIRDWAVAQLYFHVVTAYAILRNQGLALGKADYMTFMFKHSKSGPAA